MIPQFSQSASDYWKTPRRGCISLSTGKLYNPPIDGRQGGEPYRFESDAEYAARLAEHDAAKDTTTHGAKEESV